MVSSFNTNSDAFGGIGPEVIKYRFSCSLGVRISSQLFLPIKKVDTPALFSIPNALCMRGLCKSKSINNTFLEARAKIKAKVEEQKVFPSDGLMEVTKITFPVPFFSTFLPRYCRLVRMALKDSEIPLLGLRSVTFCKLIFSEKGTPPNTGIFDSLVSSRTLSILRNNTERKNAINAANNNPPPIKE